MHTWRSEDSSWALGIPTPILTVAWKATLSSPQSYGSYSLCLLANLMCLKGMEAFLGAIPSTLKVLVLPTRFILTLSVFSVAVWSFNAGKQQEEKTQRGKNFG